jgi:DNA-binding NarL/FixJ family response regulator
MTGNGALRVMVVDDHAVFAEALELAIRASAHLACVGTAAGVEAALILADETSPDAAVMDVNLVGTDGISGTRLLRQQHPKTLVLVLTGQHPSPSLTLAAAEAGASALLPKTTSLATVVNTIPTLRDHSFVVDRRTLVSLLASGSAAMPPTRRHGNPLTSRERQILELLADGSDIKTAARRLGIKVTTCRGYLKNLYNKLGAHSQLEAVAMARTSGLLERDE